MGLKEAFSEENLLKTTEADMELYEKVNTTFPSLEQYEEEIRRQFYFHYKSIKEFVIEWDEGKLYDYSMLVNGVLLRSLEYYRGCIWALGQKNLQVFIDCIRAICETLALVHYCNLNPEYVNTSMLGERGHEEQELKLVNVLTMIDKVDRIHENFRSDYDVMCNYVHPNPASLLAGIKPLGDAEKGIAVGIGTVNPNFTEELATNYLAQLVSVTDWEFEEIGSFMIARKPSDHDKESPDN